MVRERKNLFVAIKKEDTGKVEGVSETGEGEEEETKSGGGGKREARRMMDARLREGWGCNGTLTRPMLKGVNMGVWKELTPIKRRASSTNRDKMFAIGVKCY